MLASSCCLLTARGQKEGRRHPPGLTEERNAACFFWGIFCQDTRRLAMTPAIPSSVAAVTDSSVEADPFIHHLAPSLPDQGIRLSSMLVFPPLLVPECNFPEDQGGSRWLTKWERGPCRLFSRQSHRNPPVFQTGPTADRPAVTNRQPSISCRVRTGSLRLNPGYRVLNRLSLLLFASISTSGAVVLRVNLLAPRLSRLWAKVANGITASFSFYGVESAIVESAEESIKAEELLSFTSNRGAGVGGLGPSIWLAIHYLYYWSRPTL
ncbi:hypothetical protein Scep_030973 [Stephania cephalantha]|uniref:Uncharacterized protein n=1 Tax=Stephania cephalantha TaxID=152367 RepID=A0AAP0HAI4_9MAGN